MPHELELIITVLGSCLASSGVWTFIQYKTNRNDADRALLVGLAHVRITELALKYLDRGYILQSEYDELFHYLYEPYTNAGGNGTCRELMDRVKSELRIYHSPDQVPKELINNDSD